MKIYLSPNIYITSIRVIVKDLKQITLEIIIYNSFFFVCVCVWTNYDLKYLGILMQAIRIQNMHDVGLNGILSYMGYIAIGLNCIRIPGKISYFHINF